MECPHCHVHINSKPRMYFLANSDELAHRNANSTIWRAEIETCPNTDCNRKIIFLVEVGANSTLIQRFLVYPQSSRNRMAPQEVPSEIANDFNEACLVAELSPKSSAALSRRCLQHLLEDQGYKQKDLVDAIKALIDSKKLPSSIEENVDTIRVIGNFAAHPLKEKSSGLILPVEPEEAEWNLEVLESLFDFFYVRPEIDRKRKAALNLKLTNAGKKPIP